MVMLMYDVVVVVDGVGVACYCFGVDGVVHAGVVDIVSYVDGVYFDGVACIVVVTVVS